MFFVYILESEVDGSLYKGQTEDITRRLLQHNAGRTISTKSRLPWKIIYFEEFQTREEALVREKYFKSAAGRRWIKKNITKN